jgi:hypothetical protein
MILVLATEIKGTVSASCYSVFKFAYSVVVAEDCAASRKVAGSILDGVIVIFHRRNPSGRSMALGSTPPLTEMNTRNMSWGVKAAAA